MRSLQLASIARSVATAYCCAGLAAVPVFVVATFVPGEQAHRVAYTTFAIGLVMAVPAFFATVAWQTFMTFKVGHGRGIRVRYTGPRRGLILAVSAAGAAIFVYVMLSLLLQGGGITWESGGWALFFGAWIAAAQAGALPILRGQVLVEPRPPLLSRMGRRNRRGNEPEG